MTRAEAKKRIEQLAAEIREHDHRYHVLDQIGRASCRERVYSSV